MEQNIVHFNYDANSTTAKRVGINNLDYEPKCNAVGYTSLVATVSAALYSNKYKTTDGLGGTEVHNLVDSFPTTTLDIIEMLREDFAAWGGTPAITVDAAANGGFTITQTGGTANFAISFPYYSNNGTLAEILFGDASIAASALYVPPNTTTPPFYPNPTLGISNIMINVAPSNLLVVPVLGYDKSIIHYFEQKEKLDLGQYSNTATMSVYIPYLNATYKVSGNRTGICLVVSS